MGLKCSLLGHRFEETEVERDREEQGSEVVTTIKEHEICSRCGETRVVSENKEVTTLETPDDATVGAVGASDADATDDPAPGTADEPSDDVADAASDADATADAPTTDDAEILDDESPTIPDAEADAADDSTAEADAADPRDVVADVDDGGAVTDAGTDTDEDADEDAVILEESNAEPDEERDPGEWPEEPADRSVAPETAADWPDDDRDGPGTADDRRSGPTTTDWPDDDRGGGSEYDSTLLQEPDPEPTDAGDVTVPEGTYRCEECGFTTSVESSSLRPGDFCPECHRGTLAHDPDAED